MRLVRSSSLAALLSAGLIAPVIAADVVVFSAGAVEEAVAQLAAQYQRDRGQPVKAQFGTGPELEKRLAAGDTADVLIGPSAVVERAVKSGKVVANTVTPVGRVGVGIVVRRGTPAPEVGSTDALTRALLKADAVVYNQASTGQYLEGLFTRLGIAEQLKNKTRRYGNAAQVFEHVIAGTTYDIGFGPITEIKTFEPKGVLYIGPLPEDVQNYTTYLAAEMTGAQSVAARDFIRYLTTTSGRATFAATGVQ